MKKIREYGNFHKYLRKNILALFVSHFLNNRGKNKDEDRKNLENEFDLCVIDIKIRLSGNFNENLRKKVL